MHFLEFRVSWFFAVALAQMRWSEGVECAAGSGGEEAVGGFVGVFLVEDEVEDRAEL